MLKRKHRIIPIVLEGLSQMNFSMDKNLKGIIDSVTYIEWPGEGEDISRKRDKFWKQLQLSLPKKKVLECGESCTSDSLTGLSNSTGSSSIKSDSVSYSPTFIKKSLAYVTECPETPVKLLEASDNREKNVYDECDNIDDEVYDEIGDLDEALDSNITPDNIPELPDRGLSDKNECVDEPPSYDYAVAPMDEHSDVEGRYVEFRTTGKNEHVMDVIDLGYLEFEI